MTSPYLPNEAALFVVSRVQTPGQDSVFSPQLNEFVSPAEKERRDRQSAALWGQAEDARHELISLIHRVRVKQDRKYGVSSNSHFQPCEWNDVMNEIRSATMRWQDSPDKTSKTMAHIGRVGKYQEAFSSWLNILPGGDYGSPICGAFQLIIGAAGQYTKVEEIIYNELARLPEIISGASHFIRIYKDHPNHSLEAICFDLFMSVMKVMIHIMHFFLDSSVRKTLESFVKQSNYKEELFASVKEVDGNATRIRCEAEICAQERAMADSQLLLKLTTDLEQERQSNERYRESTNTLLKQLLYKFVSSEKSPSKISDSGISFDETLAIMASDPTRIDKTQKFNQQVEEQQQNKHRGRKLAQQLIDNLQYDPFSIARDVLFNLSQWDQLDPQSQAKSAAVSRNLRFRRFLEFPTSSALLINGHADMASAAGGLSPLSNSCAQLVRALEAAAAASSNRPSSSPTSHPSFFVLKWFCDRYRPYGSAQLGVALPRVREMMGSLVAQLLDQMLAKEKRIDPFVDLLNGDWGEGRGDDNDMKLTSLCIIFRNLVARLAEEHSSQESGVVVIFCVLDEISRYELGVLGSEMDAAIRRLRRLVGKHTGDDDRVTFKLLVTCQGRALGLSRHFQGSDCTLYLPEMMEPSDSDRYLASRIL